MLNTRLIDFEADNVSIGPISANSVMDTQL